MNTSEVNEKSIMIRGEEQQDNNNFIKVKGHFAGLNMFSKPAMEDNSFRSSGQHNQMNSSSSGNNSMKELNNNKTTDAQTMMHILKANIGTGVLAMPNAFKNVGLWLGFILVPIIGCICIHCMNILIASHNHLCDRFNYESLDYDQVASLGLACGPKFARRLAKYAHIVVTVFLIFTQIGFCCVYIMFVVENIQIAVLNLFNIHYSSTTYLLLVFPVIGLTSCTSNLKHLARISTLANVLQLTGLTLIFYDLVQFHTYSGSSHQQQLSTNQTSSSSLNILENNDRSKEVKVSQFVSEDLASGLPLFFATAVYAFEGIGVVLPLIKEMEEPARISGLNGVLNTGMSMVALLYMGMGFFGYAKYGQFVQGSITLNLPQTTLNEIVRVIFAIAIGLSYSLQFYVPWTIMWPFIDESLFYSYRPREPRDKLNILSKLSAANQWAFEDEDLQASQARSEISSIEVSQNNPSNEQDQQQQLQQQQQQQQQNFDGHSSASTFATSYAISSYLPSSTTGGIGGAVARARRLNLSGSTNQASLSGLTSSCQYGSITIQASSNKQQQPSLTLQELKVKRETKEVRDRLEDVREHDQDADSIPDVEWRPPPRSMRGKRKLVRYTVILVIVSFTFVAAALIPRLDLFISLIGALASSCLAIIFPAIIQLCTFWSVVEEQEQDSGEEASDEKLIAWYLFAGKNLLLVIFGILGLITGSWISISKLSASYMAVDVSS